jgi:nucleotide-binding universal stress UspA family protein
LLGTTQARNLDINQCSFPGANQSSSLKGSAMTYAAIMVYVDPDGQPEKRVRLARDLADRFRAALIGLTAEADRTPLAGVGDMVSDELIEMESEATRTKLAAKEEWFRRIAGGDHRKLEWRSMMQFPIEALNCEARSADLVIIGQRQAPGDAYNSLNPGAAILGAGRPVLLVPENVDSLQPDNIVIGWKETREARRAVLDALPLLQEATRVTVVEICEPGQEATAQNHLDDVAKYLARHRIGGGLRVILQQEGSGAAQLIQLAQDEKAELLVTGAYGHSRLGEWIFGGMTRDLLATCPICCLMSH